MFDKTTYTCNDCSQEIHRGLINAIKHSFECKKDAPSENIESHKRKEEIFKIQRNNNSEFNKTFVKMSEDEKRHLFRLSVCGMWKGDTILMGKESYDRYNNFKEEMKTKYA